MDVHIKHIMISIAQFENYKIDAESLQQTQDTHITVTVGYVVCMTTHIDSVRLMSLTYILMLQKTCSEFTGKQREQLAVNQQSTPRDHKEEQRKVMKANSINEVLQKFLTFLHPEKSISRNKFWQNAINKEHIKESKESQR